MFSLAYWLCVYHSIVLTLFCMCLQVQSPSSTMCTSAQGTEPWAAQRSTMRWVMSLDIVIAVLGYITVTTSNMTTHTDLSTSGKQCDWLHHSLWTPNIKQHNMGQGGEWAVVYSMVHHCDVTTPLWRSIVIYYGLVWSGCAVPIAHLHKAPRLMSLCTHTSHSIFSKWPEKLPLPHCEYSACWTLRFGTHRMTSGWVFTSYFSFD